ncbi:UPF0613 protein PB24D3.06c 1 [Rhypophila sp. PSN 637]
MSTSKRFTVTVHSFKGKGGHNLTAYERHIDAPHAQSESRTSTAEGQDAGAKATNALIFIGGLTSGPHTTEIDFLVDNAKISALGYSVWELHMRSSYSGFGFSNLANDAEDIASLVEYLRERQKGKVVLVGTSTGCQDLLSYATLAGTKEDGKPVDGYILLNPVSDREFASVALPSDAIEASITAAKAMLDAGDGDEIISRKVIPPVFASPVSAYRWWSLAAKGGDDDFFSSDMTDEEICKKFEAVKNRPVIFLPGEKDEMVPPTVDRKSLLERWIAAVTRIDSAEGGGAASESWCKPDITRSLSGFIPGGDHVLSERSAREWAGERVAQFLHVACLENSALRCSFEDKARS